MKKVTDLWAASSLKHHWLVSSAEMRLKMLGLQHKLPVRVCSRATSLPHSLLSVFPEQIIWEIVSLVLPSPGGLINSTYTSPPRVQGPEGFFSPKQVSLFVFKEYITLQEHSCKSRREAEIFFVTRMAILNFARKNTK